MDKEEKDIGREGHIVAKELKGMTIPVRVIDYKKMYGKKMWLVEPIGGQGSAWVTQNPIDKTVVKID